MSVMTKIQEALAAHPGVSWNDLVLRRLRTATSSIDGTVNGLWMRWLESQGYTLGSLNDRMASYWRVQNTPLNERNAFYFGYTAFFSGPVATVPGAPTIGTATPGNTTASVTFTPPGNNGGSPITGYRVTSTPGGITATGAASPITVTGLTNGTGYTFTVAAQNAIGFSAESTASNSVTPSAGAQPLVRTRSVSASGFTGMDFVVRSDGVLMGRFDGLPAEVFIVAADEWWTGGQTTEIGNNYSVSFDSDAWLDLTSNRTSSFVAIGQSVNIRIALTANTANVLTNGTITVAA